MSDKTKRITFRLVQPKDKQAVSALAKADHEESFFSYIEFSEIKFNTLFDKAVESPHFCFGAVAESRGALQGFAYATLGEYFIGDEARIVSVHVLFVKASIRDSLAGGKIAIRLLKSLQYWGRERQANAVMMHVTSGVKVKATDRFLRKLGMQTLGGNYILNL